MNSLATANQLREQARRFQDAADALMRAADILDGKPHQLHLRTDTVSVISEPSTHGGRSHRVDAVKELLQRNGPTLRRDIKEMLKWNHAAVSTTLANKKYFVKDDQGRWALK